MTTHTLMIGIIGSVYNRHGHRLGSAGAGKDTVGSLITNLVHNASTFAFAEPVKRAAMLIDPIITSNIETGETKKLIHLSEIVNDIGWDDAKREYPEVRRLLQRIGTDAGWHLHQNPNLWIDLMDASITAATESSTQPVTAVITDLRFPHEAGYVRSQGGQIIDVMRVLPTDEDAQKYLAENPYNKAASETEVILSDYTIVNDSDLQMLEDRVKHYLKHNRYGQAISALD